MTKDGAVLKVAGFVEKPDAATAERYIAEGYLWNSGNFFFRADVMLERAAEIRARDRGGGGARRSPRRGSDLDFVVLDAEAFGRAPKISIDYAVMERTEKAAVVPADIGWSDVGNWAAVWELSRSR